MANVFIEDPSHPEWDTVPMVYITIEGPRHGKSDDASLSFETKRGFGFRIRRADARTLVRKLSAYLQRTAPAVRRRTTKATPRVPKDEATGDGIRPIGHSRLGA